MSPKEDYDLMQKVDFLKRLHNKFIGNKIIQSNAFKSYTTFSMADCFSKELELEGEYQVGEVVLPGIDLQVMSATGQLTGEVIHEASASSDTEPRQRAPTTTQIPVITARRLDISRGIALC